MLATRAPIAIRSEQQQGSVESEPGPASPQPSAPDASPDDDELVPPLETEPGTPTTPTEPPADGSPGVGITPTSSGRAQMRDARKLLDFLIGSDERAERQRGERR